MRDSTPAPCLLFWELFRRLRVAAFEVPNANSDGGAILLEEAAWTGSGSAGTLPGMFGEAELCA